MTRATVLLGVLALAASGCMSAELARVRRDIGAAAPSARLAGGHAPQGGRLTLALARAFVDADVRHVLAPVRGVAVGRYAARGPVAFDALDLRPTEARLIARGWEPVVAVRDSADIALVYARTRGDALRDLLVVALDADGLTLVRVSGALDGRALARLVGPHLRASDLLGAAR